MRRETRPTFAHFELIFFTCLNVRVRACETVCSTLSFVEFPKNANANAKFCGLRVFNAPILSDSISVLRCVFLGFYLKKKRPLCAVERDLYLFCLIYYTKLLNRANFSLSFRTTATLKRFIMMKTFCHSG